jgi:DNA-binding NarL/FixJ family response regulator
VRKGLVALLGAVDRMVVVGEAADGAEAIDKARALRPDIVLMDYDMPGMNGMAATGILRRELPECKVIILSMHREADEVLQLLDSGARGYVLKEAPAEELLRAVEIVNAGQPFFSPEVASVALNSFIRSGDARKKDPLTAREREVLVHIAEGLSNKEIATRLQVGVRTVETHRERIMRKLDIHSIAGLTRYALAKGLISLQK